MNTYSEETVQELIELHSRLNEELISAAISEISWERIIMHLEVQIERTRRFVEEYGEDRELQFYLVTDYARSNAYFDTEKTDDGGYVISLNITNPGYCRCLPKGTYKIYICAGNDILATPEIAPELAPCLAERSREFMYSKKNRAYCVDFSIAEDDSGLYPEIRVINTKGAGIKAFTEAPKKEPSANSQKFFNLKRVRNYMTKYYHYESGKADRSFNGEIRNILFMTEQSETLGSNLTSVIDKMKERGLDKEYNILTSARYQVEKSYSMQSWASVIKKVADADMIFLDDHCPIFDWLTLSPRTTLIQLWHAGAGFKSSGYSRWGHTGCPGPVSCHRQYDYGISGSTRVAHFHSEVFGVNREMLLPTGMPRMDEYLSPEYRKSTEKRLREEFPLTVGKEVILFAPTYRGKNRDAAHYPYEMIDFDELYKFCRETDKVVLFKMHPWVSQPVPIEDRFKDRFIDLTAYPNINDLFYITDLLITDYSSNIYEYSLMRRPMLFYAFDKIQYAFSRGFHRDYEEAAPGRICYDFESLMRALREEDYQFEKVEKYVDLHFEHMDSHASDRVIDWFILKHIPDEYVSKLKERQLRNEQLKRLDFSAAME